MNQVLIKAAPIADGSMKRRVRQQDAFNRFITEDEPVLVEWSSYYQRLLTHGEIELVEAKEPKPQRKARAEIEEQTE